MRTEAVTVQVTYILVVEVDDDADNQAVLDQAEADYAAGELGILEDHVIDPDGDFAGVDAEGRTEADWVAMGQDEFNRPEQS